MKTLIAIDILIACIIIALTIWVINGHRHKVNHKPISKLNTTVAIAKESSISTMNDFTITHYCPCEICNDGFAGYVCDGHTMKYYLIKGEHIAAVDPTVIKLGSTFIYNKTMYTARDVGRLIKGKHIDILVGTHAEACRLGILRNQRIIIQR